MASFDLPDIPQPRVSPALLVGVASPLWSYYGAVAAGGMAYWWMTRWTRPVNLEAMLGALQPPAALAAVAAPVVEPMLEVAEAAAEAVVEAAPISVIAETVPALDPLAAPTPEPESEVTFAVAPEPVIDEPAPVAAMLEAEPALKPRARKVTPSAPETDA